MIPAVVLAAGLSRRMGGRPKALLPIGDGRTFAEAIIDAFFAADVPEVVVVVGHESGEVSAHLARTRPQARIVANSGYRSGQFSSVLAGLEAVDHPGVDAILMTLVDVPGVAASTVRVVMQRFRETGAPIVRPVCGTDHGHPVLLARSLFNLVRRATPSTGLKPIVRANVSAVGDVEIADRFAFRDVDTPADYKAFRSQSGRG